MKGKISKREMLVGSASLSLFTAAAPGTAQAQEIFLSPEQIGELHRQFVFEAGQFIEGDPLSPDSLKLALRRLSQYVNEDFSPIAEMIDAIFGGESLSQIADRLQELYESFQQQLGDVARSLAIVTIDSAIIAGDIVQTEVVIEIMNALAHDVRGAIDGAANGAALAVQLGLDPLRGALWGLLCGGAAASLIGLYGAREA